MKEKKAVREKWIKFRVNEKEHATITGFCEASTARGISEYARNVLLKKPVIIKYRNQSADEILSVMIAIKNQLHAIGNNFNQVVHKMHMLDTIPEVRSWLIIAESSRQSLLIKTEEIKQQMKQIYRQWSQR